MVKTTLFSGARKSLCTMGVMAWTMGEKSKRANGMPT